MNFAGLRKPNKYFHIYTILSLTIERRRMRCSTAVLPNTADLIVYARKLLCDDALKYMWHKN